MLNMATDIVSIKRLVTSCSQATRHASVITEQDVDELEKALDICFVPVMPDDLRNEVVEALNDPVQFEWEANKHEAQHRKEYLAALESQVGTRWHAECFAAGTGCMTYRVMTGL